MSPSSSDDGAEAVSGSQGESKIEEPKAEDTYHLTGSKLYLVLAGLGLAIYLFALDIAVIATVRSLLSLSDFEVVGS